MECREPQCIREAVRAWGGRQVCQDHYDNHTLIEASDIPSDTIPGNTTINGDKGGDTMAQEIEILALAGQENVQNLKAYIKDNMGVLADPLLTSLDPYLAIYLSTFGSIVDKARELPNL